jgi:hypothetical protein
VSLARIRSTFTTTDTTCSRCTQPIPAWVHHWLLAGARVGLCCIRDDERNAG